MLDCEILHTCNTERNRLEAILLSLFQHGLRVDRKQARDALRDELLGVITSNCMAGTAA